MNREAEGRNRDREKEKRKGKETYRLLEVAVVGAAVRRAVDQVGGIAGVGDAALESLSLTLNVDVGSGDSDGGGGESEEGGEDLHGDWRCL